MCINSCRGCGHFLFLGGFWYFCILQETWWRWPRLFWRTFSWPSAFSASTCAPWVASGVSCSAEWALMAAFLVALPFALAKPFWVLLAPKTVWRRKQRTTALTWWRAGSLVAKTRSRFLKPFSRVRFELRAKPVIVSHPQNTVENQKTVKIDFLETVFWAICMTICIQIFLDIWLALGFVQLNASRSLVKLCPQNSESSPLAVITAMIGDLDLGKMDDWDFLVGGTSCISSNGVVSRCGSFEILCFGFSSHIG